LLTSRKERKYRAIKIRGIIIAIILVVVAKDKNKENKIKFFILNLSSNLNR
jgi:hypothetical protein